MTALVGSEGTAPRRAGDELTVDEKEVFSKLDREMELLHELRQAFAGLEYLLDLDEFVSHWRTGRALFEAELGVAPATSPAGLLTAYARLRFALFGMFSMHLSLTSYAFEGAKLLRRSQTFESIVTEWKLSGPCRLLQGIRNRLQHGSMLLGRLDVEVRFEAHPQGPGTSSRFAPEPEWWAKLANEAPAQGKEFYRSVLEGTDSPLLRLIEEYERELVRFREKILMQFEDSYPDEMRMREELLRELQAVRDWQDQVGLLDPARVPAPTV